ncbi:glycoside hydrolase [Altererythrobacter arenosus]|uniref:Glycoside hydrolase n=1 Tax=Altererythrobacter arenosus TaxID=3032592 RepID=A0ABY8FQF5_9SPHN|nr:glycoside hydrolase [Altererythrobacter sp. CAU 1644]WFL77243.1 glycoside hydrolase [Altererythrobacter sp. CAU 1644]
MQVRSALLSLLAALGACATTPAAPPAELRAEPFYAKHVSAEGIPILASAKVPDKALLAARDMIRGMLSYRPDLAQWLAENDYRVAIIAEDEALLDLPDKANWQKPSRDDPRLTRCERKLYDERIGILTAREYWDRRARGIGGERTAGSEEDILGYRSSRYWGETIFVHEFAHNVLFAIEGADPALYREVEAAYANALANGLWLNEYTTTTVQEYWAEGTQFWFDSNRLQAFDGRQILGHEDLAAYDPMLFAALKQAYGDNHRLGSDPFWMSEARIPPGPLPTNTAEVC